MPGAEINVIANKIERKRENVRGICAEIINNQHQLATEMVNRPETLASDTQQKY